MSSVGIIVILVAILLVVAMVFSWARKGQKPQRTGATPARARSGGAQRPRSRAEATRADVATAAESPPR